MCSFSNDSKNTWLYTGFTIINLLGGYYIFCLWHPELIGYIRLNLILYVLSMGVQMYWCSKYLIREVKNSLKIISYIIKSWKWLAEEEKENDWSAEHKKRYFYDIALRCDEKWNM